MRLILFIHIDIGTSYFMAQLYEISLTIVWALKAVQITHKENT